MKSLVATLFMCASVGAILYFTNLPDIITACICGATGVVIYAIALILLSPTEIREHIRGKND